MRNKQKLNSSTMLSSSADYQRQLLDALVNGQAEREKILRELFGATANDNAAGQGPSNDNAKKETRWDRIRENKEPMSMQDLASALKALSVVEGGLNDAKLSAQRKSPLAQKEFYDAIQKGVTDAEAIKKQFIALREEAKKEKGYLSKAFNIFSREKPIEAVLENVQSFEKYCHKNGISFDEVSHQMVAGEKPKTKWDKMKEFRFLIAAAGGAALGLAGFSVMAHVAPLAVVPGLFFKALPYFAVPFMGLNIFRAFSEKNISEQAETFCRFGAMMLCGFLIGAGVTSLMAGLLPHLAGSGAAAAGTGAVAKEGFSPFHYIIQVMIGGAVGSGIYKMAKNKVKSPEEQAAAYAKKSRIAKIFDKAASPFINRFTAPAIVKAGKWAEKAAGVTDKAFGNYMNWVGAPAVFLMMSDTFSKGLAPMLGYAGYYATVFAGMGICAAALAVTDYVVYHTRRKKDMQAIAKTVGTAFSVSSGVATMPTTKESLRIMGVPRATRESIVPLSANFNMLGTSLYLGTTVFAANYIFGHTMDLMHKIAVGAIVALHGYGAPGMPSSNLSLLAPVLGLTGLSNAAIQKVYDMVIPGDRLLDMSQTAINVWGDMTIALGKHRRDVKRRAKNIKKIRDKRLGAKAEEKPAPVPAPQPAAATPPAPPAPKP